jgi:hypothetical protein
MSLSAEAAQRFGAYIAQTDPVNIAVAYDDALFDFAGWALVHQPEALKEPASYERVMTERGFGSNKMAYVQTVIVAAQPLLDAYQRQHQ